MTKTISLPLFAALCAVLTPSLSAAPISIPFSGNTSTDGWAELNSANYPGYGFFPGTTGWPASIGSNTAGSGDAELGRVSGGSGGGPYPAGSSIYFGSFANAGFGGTLSVSDATPLAHIQALVLQIEIGDSFYEDALPALFLNGAPLALAPDFSGLTDQRSYMIPNPDPEGEGEVEVFVNTFGLQWDLSGVTEPVTAFSVQFSASVHSQVYALQLDQSDAVHSTSLVPEPSGLALIGLGCAALIARRRRARPAISDPGF